MTLGLPTTLRQLGAILGDDLGVQFVPVVRYQLDVIDVLALEVDFDKFGLLVSPACPFIEAKVNLMIYRMLDQSPSSVKCK